MARGRKKADLGVRRKYNRARLKKEREQSREKAAESPTTLSDPDSSESKDATASDAAVASVITTADVKDAVSPLTASILTNESKCEKRSWDTAFYQRIAISQAFTSSLNSPLAEEDSSTASRIQKMFRKY